MLAEADTNQCIVSLRQKVAALKAELTESQAQVEKLKHSSYGIRISSWCTNVEHTQWTPVYSDCSRIDWHTWCPCCRRPLDLSLFGPHSSWDSPSGTWPASSDSRPQSYAYAAALWGSHPGYVLGALVLAQALRRTGAKYEMVLMHSFVKDESLQLLEKAGWKLKYVEYIDATAALFSTKEGRFEGVFTKLHALDLVEYDKVLMLDIDLAIIHCPDELFQLQAPAALRRGIHHHDHGALIDGRRWFAGEEHHWVQCGGINAGVMLLEPNAKLFKQAQQETLCPWHPSHIPGNGPEQDYLSRFYAHTWHHLSVKWNWQLHWTFYALDAVLLRLSSTPPELQGIEDGTALQCVALPLGFETLPVFAAADSWDTVDYVLKHNTVVAQGPPVYEQGCPMIPLQYPTGFVDGRYMKVTQQKVQTSLQGLQNSIDDDTGRPAGFSLTQPITHAEKQKESHMPEAAAGTSDDIWKDWLPERLLTDVEEVCIIHFSGHYKIWHRFLEGSTESDEDFASRLMDVNNPEWWRLFKHKQGTHEEYRYYGVVLDNNGQWKPDRAGQIIDKSVAQVYNAALIATKCWKTDYASLLEVLGCAEEQLLQEIGIMETYGERASSSDGYGERGQQHGEGYGDLP